VIALALAAGVVLSACSSTDRSAAPAEEDVATDQVTESVEELATQSESEAVVGFSPDTKTCPEKSSTAYIRKVTNDLSFPIILSAGEYTCFDWSGVSTPGHVFNDLRLEPGQSVKVRLEPAITNTQNWTMAVRQPGTDVSLGTIRMTIASLMGQDDYNARIAGAATTKAPPGSARQTATCGVLNLARTTEPDTPGAKWDWNFESDMLSFAVLNGNITAVASCIR
jgi:hypothetical protein